MVIITDVSARDGDDSSSFPLVHHLPVGVLVADEDGFVSLANQALIDAFQLDVSPDDLVGRPLVAVHAELAQQAQLPELVLDDDAGVPDSQVPIRGRRIDLISGRHLIKESFSVSVTSGQRWVYLYRDATAEIEASDQAAAAQARAEEIAEQRAWLLSMVSHEVRTPLSGVVGLVELLMSEDLPDYMQEIVSGIRRSADSVAELLENLLVISRIDAGKLILNARTTDVRELLEDAVETVGPDARTKGLALSLWLHPSVPAAIAVDSARLKQVLLNLLSNAIKSTDSGEVAVSAEAVDGWLRMRILDSGPGMDTEDLDRLFRPFEQGSNLQPGGGAGLGLTIVRSLLEHMDGEVDVDSRPGMGTAFRIGVPLRDVVQTPAEPIVDLADARVVLQCAQPLASLALVTVLRSMNINVVRETDPASGEDIDAVILVADGSVPTTSEQLAELRARWQPARTVLLNLGTASNLMGTSIAAMPVRRARLVELLRGGPAAVDASPKEPETQSLEGLGLKVLVAEDSPANQALLRTMLGRIGVEATVVSDGEAAVAAVVAERFDAVLMDVSMPQLDGHDATRLIRNMSKSESDPQIPIIGLSAATLEEDRAVCLAVGMDDYLTKPVSIAALRSVLKNVAPQHGSGVPKQRSGVRATKPTVDPEALLAKDAEREAWPVLDSNRLTSLTEEIGDGNVVAESINIFLEELEPRLISIDAARNDSDHTTIARALHTLVSPSAMLGAEELASACRDMEQHCRELTDQEISSAVDRIRSIAVRTDEAMRKYLSTSST
ncbi:MAG: hypothetical protein CMH41_08115 [Micrococcales bacterium]|nr:hypothetical protein [Micrococcales bacterium]